MKRLYKTFALVLCAALININAAVAGDQYYKFNSNDIKVIGTDLKNNEIVSLNIFFKGGSSLLTESNAGIEELTLNVMLEGSKEYPRQKLYEELIPLGTQINNSSNYDYSVISMKCLRKYFAQSFAILASLLQNPLLEESEIKKAQDNMVASIKNTTDNPDKYIWQLVNNSLFKGHPYSNYTQGFLNTLPNMKRDDLVQWHKKLLDSNRILVTCAGNMPSSELKNYMGKYFNFFHKGDYKDVDVPDYKTSPQINFEQRNIPNSFVICKFQSPNLKSDDYPAFNLVLEILGERLKQKVRTEQGLAYSISAGKSIYKSNFGSIHFSTPKPETVLGIVADEINKMKTDLVTMRSIQDSVNLFYTYNFLNQQSNSSLSTRIGLYEILSKGYDYESNIMEKVKNTTPQEIKDAANKYLKNFHIGIIAKSSEAADSEVFKKFIEIK